MRELSGVQGYFKLKHDVQNDSELPLARAELEAALGSAVEEVINPVDLLVERLSMALDPETRLHDRICWHPYPGALQGFYCETLELDGSVLARVRRLAYFREVYLLWEGATPGSFLARLGMQPPRSHEGCQASLTPQITLYRLGRGWCLRIVPDQVMYEFSDFVCRLARNERDVERMFRAGVAHLQSGVRRAYSAESSRLFKTIEDFMDDRRAPQLYLTHWFFGIHGKFFPRMIRAAMNKMGLGPGDLVLDPFTGCGTLNVEASLMGVRSVGVEVNPLLAMVSRVKVRALSLDADYLTRLIEKVSKELTERPLAPQADVGEALARLPQRLAEKVRRDSLATVMRIIEIAESAGDPDLSDLLKVPLAYWMRSMLTKQTPEKVVRTYLDHLMRMGFAVRFLALYRMEVAPVEPADAKILVGDSTKLKDVLGSGAPRELTEGFDAVVTSPPYMTAIDYVGEQVYALYLLGLTKDHLEVDRYTLGSTRGVRASDWDETLLDTLPEEVSSFLTWLRPRRPKLASALLKYFAGIRKSLAEVFSVLKHGGKVAWVIGSRQVMSVKGVRREVPVAKWMAQMGESVGFDLEGEIRIELAKSTERGAIPTESLIFLKKP